MNRVPEIFLSEVFGELRIIEENNKFYFCAVDVCKALGYTNITRELNIHCRQDGIKSGRVEVGVDGAGMDLEGILDDGDDGCDRCEGQHDAQKQKDDIIGLGKVGLELVQQDRTFARPQGGGLVHGTLLFRDGAPWKAAHGRTEMVQPAPAQASAAEWQAPLDAAGNRWSKGAANFTLRKLRSDF